MLLFGGALLVAAWRAQERGTRLFLLACAALNLLSFAHMLATRHEYTWHLAPPDHAAPDPSWRR